MKSKNVKPCGESSPYWNWVRANAYFSENDQCYYEYPTANPDSLPENVCIVSEELQAILDTLDQGAESVLSPQEKLAFQFVVREGISYRESARKMNISRSSVEVYVKRAAKKIRILCRTKL